MEEYLTIKTHPGWYDKHYWTSPADAVEPDSYEKKLKRLSKKYPAVAEAKAHLDALMVLVEHGE